MLLELSGNLRLFVPIKRYLVVFFFSQKITILLRLHLEFLPLRLHLDQGQLNFLIQFFSKDSSSDKSQSLAHDLDDSENTGKERASFGRQTIVEEALLPFFQVLMFYSSCQSLHCSHITIKYLTVFLKTFTFLIYFK